MANSFPPRLYILSMIDQVKVDDTEIRIIVRRTVLERLHWQEFDYLLQTVISSKWQFRLTGSRKQIPRAHFAFCNLAQTRGRINLRDRLTYANETGGGS
jgi:hypothetical protein